MGSIAKWKVLTGQTRLISSWWCETWPYSFALTRISPSDFALLYEMMGSSLYISLSSGWSWIKCHLLIKMFLRFCKAGWYVVTKGRIVFRTSLFFCKADFRSVRRWIFFFFRGDFFYEIVRVTSSTKAFFEVVDVFIEGVCWGVSSQSKGLAFYETFSDPMRVTGREMRVLKSLCRFKMCADGKDSLVVKSPFPVLTRDWNKFLFFSGPLRSSTFA